MRLMAALFAAIGLHALALFWPASPVKNIMHNGVLRVDLLDHAMTAFTAQRQALNKAAPFAHRRPTKPPVRSSLHTSRPSMPVPHPYARAQPTIAIVRKSLRMRNKPPRAAAAANSGNPALSTNTAVSSLPAHKIRFAPFAGAPVIPFFAMTPLSVARMPGYGSLPKASVGKKKPARSSRRFMHGSGRISPQVRSMLLASITYPRLARRRGWQGKGEFQLLIARQNVRKVRMLASTGHRQLDQAATHGLLAAGHIPLGDGIYKLPVEFRLR